MIKWRAFVEKRPLDILDFKFINITKLKNLIKNKELLVVDHLIAIFFSSCSSIQKNDTV